jgi:hypothetical protein
MHKNQIAGLQSLVTANFVPKAARHGKSERSFIFELGKRQRTFEELASTFGFAVSWVAKADLPR